MIFWNLIYFQIAPLSLGVVDGRNIWKNDFKKSVTLIQKAIDAGNRPYFYSAVLLFNSFALRLSLSNEETLTLKLSGWLLPNKKIESRCTSKFSFK
jgi:5-methyltetrahydropteroyltriglutamate--homocysteine methyltransferase